MRVERAGCERPKRLSASRALMVTGSCEAPLRCSTRTPRVLLTLRRDPICDTRRHEPPGQPLPAHPTSHKQRRRFAAAGLNVQPDPVVQRVVRVIHPHTDHAWPPFHHRVGQHLMVVPKPPLPPARPHQPDRNRPPLGETRRQPLQLPSRPRPKPFRSVERRAHPTHIPPNLSAKPQRRQRKRPPLLQLQREEFPAENRRNHRPRRKALPSLEKPLGPPNHPSTKPIGPSERHRKPIHIPKPMPRRSKPAIHAHPAPPCAANAAACGPARCRFQERHKERKL